MLLTLVDPQMAALVFVLYKHVLVLPNSLAAIAANGFSNVFLCTDLWESIHREKILCRTVFKFHVLVVLCQSCSLPKRNNNHF